MVQVFTWLLGLSLHVLIIDKREGLSPGWDFAVVVHNISQYHYCICWFCQSVENSIRCGLLRSLQGAEGDHLDHGRPYHWLSLRLSHDRLQTAYGMSLLPNLIQCPHNLWDADVQLKNCQQLLDHSNQMLQAVHAAWSVLSPQNFCSVNLQFYLKHYIVLPIGAGWASVKSFTEYILSPAWVKDQVWLSVKQPPSEWKEANRFIRLTFIHLGKWTRLLACSTCRIDFGRSNKYHEPLDAIS